MYSGPGLKIQKHRLFFHIMVLTPISYRMNPTFARGAKRAREETPSEESDSSEVPVDKEMKKKLHEANKKVYELEKTNAKIISCVG